MPNFFPVCWKPIILVLALLLGACTALDVVKQKGAALADQGLTDAEWVVCKLTPIGAIKRRYGQTVERADTYKDFCYGDGQANVIAP